MYNLFVKFGGDKMNNLEYYINNFLNDTLIFKSYDTYIFYKSHLKTSLSYFQEKEINYITLCEYVLFLKQKKLSNATINKKILSLKVCLKFNKVNNQDLYTFKKLKEEKKTFKCLDKKQVFAYVDYIESSKMSLQNKLILSLFLDSGCRLSELINIKTSNINLNLNYILLEKTKTSSERCILFTEETKQKYLIPYLDTNNKEYLFNIKKSAIRSLFERTKKQLHFAKMHPHMLRHTYATILINNNCDLEFIRLTLGHSNLTTTQRYLHYNLDKMCSTYKTQYHL